jgi:hypothetical protein
VLLYAKRGVYLKKMKSKKSFITSFKNKLLSKFSKRYYLVYKNQHGKIKTYQIGNIDLYNSFGNKSNHRDNVGFRAFCYGRNQVRSFRHDRIISITKK